MGRLHIDHTTRRALARSSGLEISQKVPCCCGGEVEKPATPTIVCVCTVETMSNNHRAIGLKDKDRGGDGNDRSSLYHAYANGTKKHKPDRTTAMTRWGQGSYSCIKIQFLAEHH
jgi:hypothetical protein